MLRLPLALAAPILTLSLAGPAVAGASSLVVCAPGYPGTTDTARPTMDALAAGIAGAAGQDPGSWKAEYHPTLEGGLERLERDDATLALVGLPFYLKYRERFDLRPLLQVATEAGDTERYTLVARKGAVSGPGSLDGWQVHGLQGYAPEYVRGVLLAAWGGLPDGAEVRFTSRIVSSLRKAAAGESVAVLLDPAQAEALPNLPFAADLEVVTRSVPVAASLLCSVGDRLPAATASALVPALLKLHEAEDGRVLLESIRMGRFVPVDAQALGRVQQGYARP